jgi:Elongation factor Tu domain 2.
MDNIDNLVDVLNESESKNNASIRANDQNKVIIGTVEYFFDKIDVVAVNLTAGLRIGDKIEIGNDESSIMQKVSNMQINRKDVSEAYKGDSVGIKLDYKVRPGSVVYKIYPKDEF